MVHESAERKRTGFDKMASVATEFEMALRAKTREELAVRAENEAAGTEPRAEGPASKKPGGSDQLG